MSASRVVGTAGPVGLPAPTKELYPMSNWKYDSFLWTISILIDLFFREVHPRGSWKVPRDGPVLFVAAPHANQFVDALILQRTLRREAKRRVSLLIARKSVHGFIGWGSRQVGSVPVGRAQDSAKQASGTIFLVDPIGDPTLVQGVGTRFDVEVEIGGMLFLPSGKKQSGSNVDVSEIIAPDLLRVKRPFKGRFPLEQLTGRTDIDDDGYFADQGLRGPQPGYGGTKYKLAPRIDQTTVYEAVFDRLRSGGCVGIFPEGGSHDRTELLPLKAGVAIMALGTLADAPDCDLRIVPVGMNYFHPHKFRSRAVVEFGQPLRVPTELVDMYRNGNRRDAIGQLLDVIHSALSAVTVSTPNYDTLMVIQAARRLYNPQGKKLPLPIVVELNRRLAKGYERYKDDERIVHLSDAVKDYNRQLHYLNLRDHQVQYGKMSSLALIATLFYRLAKLAVLSTAVLPGLVLFAPVFILTKWYSHKKAREALAASSVKIKARDVMATWKLLVSMAFAPVLYNAYTVLLAYKVHRDRLWGHVPDWVPLWMVFLAGWVVFPAITYAALRFGEVGMDIVKSLRPLVLCINPASSYNIQQLREKRADLQAQVIDVINELGPEMFPDFDRMRLVSPSSVRGPRTAAAVGDGKQQAWSAASSSPAPSSPTSPVGPLTRRHDSAKSLIDGLGADGTGPTDEAAATADMAALSRRDTTKSSRAMPRNESFNNIGRVSIFPTRPPSRGQSRGHSRSGSGSGSSGGFGVGAFTPLDSKEGFEEASRKIRAAMHERSTIRRRRKASDRAKMVLGGDDLDDGYGTESDGDRR